MSFVLGENKILYIQETAAADNVLPIACLTANVLSESMQFISTTTRDNAGWDTSIPVSQGYTVSFSGISDTVSTSKIILSELRDLKRAKTRIVWAVIDFEAQQIDYGQGYLGDISENAPDQEYVTFEGQIIGYGQPYNGIPTPTITAVDNVFIGGGGNYLATIDFTSSDDPVNIWGRLYTINSGNAGVLTYRSGVLETTGAPLEPTVADKEAFEPNSASGNTGWSMRFQFDTGWLGPLSNTS